jgi:hypothetical protein
MKVGRIRTANEIIIPVEEKKIEAPFAIELFYQIKVINYIRFYDKRFYLIVFIIFKRRLQKNFKIFNEIEREIKKIKENKEKNNIFTDSLTYLQEVIKETPNTPKKFKS